MTAILVLTVLVTLAVLAPWLGRDSRGLGDHARSRDALWSR